MNTTTLASKEHSHAVHARGAACVISLINTLAQREAISHANAAALVVGATAHIMSVNDGKAEAAELFRALAAFLDADTDENAQAVSTASLAYITANEAPEVMQ